MRQIDGNENGSSERSRRIASGALAVTAVVAANLLVVNADTAKGQDFYDLVADRTPDTISVAIPSAPASVDATLVAAPDLPELESLDDIDFVVPVLERREAVLPALPEIDGAPWMKNGVPPAPRADLEIAPPEVEGASALDDLRIEVPELRLPASVAAAPSGR